MCRMRRSNLLARLRISSTDILVPSVGCDCHSTCTELDSRSLMGAFSLLKPACEEVLYTVNLRGDVSGRKPCNLADRGGVQAFEIGQDHVSVERIESLDQFQQAVERVTPV